MKPGDLIKIYIYIYWQQWEMNSDGKFDKR